MTYAVQNFTYCPPTRLFFGKESIASLPTILEPLGRKVLLVYGGGSIKHNGIYVKLKELLSNFNVVEFGGVQSNPQISMVNAGAKICQEQGIDLVLAVGGGSVVDCAKAICAATFYDGDAWDLVLDNTKVTKALPLVAVITLAATGSEYDCGCGLSNSATHQKMAIIHPLLFPVAAICDPQYTYTVSKRQTAAGVADIISHILEQFCVKESNLIADGLCAAVMHAAVIAGKEAYADGFNYDARSNMLWASTLACNSLCGMGTSFQAWACHAIEHGLAAFYNTTHGEGLAILTPIYLRYVLSEDNAPRFAKLFAHVFDLPYGKNDLAQAQAGIKALEDLFAALNLPRTLSELNITATYFEEIATEVMTHWHLDQGMVPLGREDVLKILKRAL